MPPVLTMSSTNYDYDTVQSYFFLDGEEEGFYPPPRCQLLPGPSEDIWKKFELLHTPPLSPSRRPSAPENSPSAADHLEMVSDLLGEECHPSAAFLQSFIIQDCMWSSSFAAATELEKVVSERLAALQARRDSDTAPGTDELSEQTRDQQVCRSRGGTAYLQDLNTAVRDCIDPAAVLPDAPLDGKRNTSEVEVGSDLCLDSPPLSSSDSESEKELDEEDEEIDVVTVDRRKVSGRLVPCPLVLKRSHINMHQHNYAARLPPASARLPPAPKRLKADGPGGGGRRCCSPTGGEDEDRRRTHNVLERQRRSELKTSFLLLRDEVPAVADNDRAAKVVILKKATEFVGEIRAEERRLLSTKDGLRKRSRELRRQLEQLRTSS